MLLHYYYCEILSLSLSLSFPLSPLSPFSLTPFLPPSFSHSLTIKIVAPSQILDSANLRP